MLALAGLLWTRTIAIGFNVAVPDDLPGGPTSLLNALRWSAVEGSFVETGVRGLGGGLEYSVSDDFCEKLLPRVQDPGATCEDIRDVVRSAFSRWASINENIEFVDVSKQIKAALPDEDPPRWGYYPIGPPGSWELFGAEIDLFADNITTQSPHQKVGAFVNIRYSSEDPLGTHGRRWPGNTILSVDIVVSQNEDLRWCLSQQALVLYRPCAHLESVLLHEIGHALGLGHPTEKSNYDTDENPKNPIPIACEDPYGNLRLSPHVDERATLSPKIETGWVHHLTNDDIGGLRFLYPECGRFSPRAATFGRRDSIAEQDVFRPPSEGVGAASSGTEQSPAEIGVAWLLLPLGIWGIYWATIALARWLFPMRRW